MANNYGKTFEYEDDLHGGKCSKTWVFNRTSGILVIKSKYGEGYYETGAKQEECIDEMSFCSDEAECLSKVLNDWLHGGD